MFFDVFTIHIKKYSQEYKPGLEKENRSHITVDKESSLAVICDRLNTVRKDYTFILYREFLKYFDKLLVERLIRADCFRQWHIDNLIVTDTNHNVALSLHYGLYGTNTCT